uniref:Uncharacterized protein n=1 Tax=Neolamprologus brichardi TaxID=32507 RepID=A0A3Q4N0Q9_NEOBR
MEAVLSLVSLTVTKALQFSGLTDNWNAPRAKKMEEKALEVLWSHKQGSTALSANLSTYCKSVNPRPRY